MADALEDFEEIKQLFKAKMPYGGFSYKTIWPGTMIIAGNLLTEFLT